MSLDDWITRLRKLGDSRLVAARVAQVAAPLVDAEIKKTVRAGQDPLSRPWAPKKDGGQPLVNASQHITTKALENLVVVTLTGPEVFHHLGAGNSPRRQIIPDGASVPESVTKALETAARQVFDELVKGTR